VSKAGLPMGVKMRHDAHYVDQIAAKSRSVGRTIPITSIFPNPEQPRTEFGDLTELTDSIKEKGVLEPLLVRPTDDGKFMIIAGERRWRASQLAGLEEVPCIEMQVDDKVLAEIALIENLQRKDLTVWEEADGLAALKEKFGYTQDEIAQKISKGRTTVTELLTIAGLPVEIRARCKEANMNAKAMLLEVARQFDEAAMFEFLDNLELAFGWQAQHLEMFTCDLFPVWNHAGLILATRSRAVKKSDHVCRCSFNTRLPSGISL